MNNIDVDDGYKSFSINNDESRIIRFNPSDNAILTRIDISNKKIGEKLQNIKNDFEITTEGKAKDEQFASYMSAINQFIYDEVDFIFNSKVSEIVFNGTSPLSTVKGEPYYQRFMMAVKPIIEKEIKAEQKAAEQRIAKYTSKYAKKGSK